MPHLLHELIPFFAGVAIVLFLAYSQKMPRKAAPPPQDPAPEPIARNAAVDAEIRDLIRREMAIEALELYQKTYHVDINTAGHAITAIAKTVLPPGSVEG